MFPADLMPSITALSQLCHDSYHLWHLYCSLEPWIGIKGIHDLILIAKIGKLVFWDTGWVSILTETDLFKALAEMFAGGHSDLRLTLETEERKDVLLGLCQAVRDLDGSMVSVGPPYGDVVG